MLFLNALSVTLLGSFTGAVEHNSAQVLVYNTKLGTQVVQMLAAEIRRRGKSGIMVTHDRRMVEFTDRTLSILDGSVTETQKDGAA